MVEFYFILFLFFFCLERLQLESTIKFLHKKKLIHSGFAKHPSRQQSYQHMHVSHVIIITEWDLSFKGYGFMKHLNTWFPWIWHCVAVWRKSWWINRCHSTPYYICCCAAHIFVCVAFFIPPLSSHKIRIYKQINAAIDGRQIKTIMATSSNSSAELISF